MFWGDTRCLRGIRDFLGDKIFQEAMSKLETSIPVGRIAERVLSILFQPIKLACYRELVDK